MKKLNLFALLAVVALALPTFANAKPGATGYRTVKLTATVESLDPANRTVTLKGPEGNLQTIKCGPEVRNYDQIKVGDKVHIERTEAMALYVREASEPASSETTSSTLKTAEKGEKPGMVSTETKEVTAKVEDINQKTRHLTLKGPDGNLVTLKVGDEVKKFNEIKKGDEVVAQYTDSLAIHVTTPEKTTTKAKK